MLTRVEIRDFALIEHVCLEPGQGLLILTGETGAGKSILIDAIGALTGGRISRDMIRHGASFAAVEAVFEITRNMLPDELIEQLDMSDEPVQELILAREIASSGKSTCRINGRLASLSLLKEIAQYLIDIHGQHDQQAIFRIDSHLQLLDRFGGEPVSSAWQFYLDLLQHFQACLKEIAALGSDPAERARQLDLLKYQFDEINDAALKEDEDELLAQRRRIIANAAKVREALTDACELIAGDQSESILARLSLAAVRVDAVNRQTGALDETAARLTEAIDMLEDAAAELRDFLEDSDADPEELERLDERLDLIFRLKKKYGGSVAAVLEYGRLAEENFERLSGGEARYEQLQTEKEQWRRKLIQAGRQLSALRREAGSRLEQLICSELADLGMKNARFEVHFADIAESPATFSRSGLDEVEFLLSANRGEPVRQLARIASGGEASRIMLAIKTILAQADRIPVLIFDEIDTGVSGRTAGKVGEKLLQLSSGRQIFCITHMAQIAAMADQHWLIEKNSDLNRTWTVLKELDPADRESELARLLSGGIGDDAAHQLAGSLLDQARLTRLHEQDARIAD